MMATDEKGKYKNCFDCNLFLAAWSALLLFGEY